MVVVEVQIILPDFKREPPQILNRQGIEPNCHRCGLCRVLLLAVARAALYLDDMGKNKPAFLRLDLGNSCMSRSRHRIGWVEWLNHSVVDIEFYSFSQESSINASHFPNRVLAERPHFSECQVVARRQVHDGSRFP